MPNTSQTDKKKGRVGRPSSDDNDINVRDRPFYKLLVSKLKHVKVDLPGEDGVMVSHALVTGDLLNTTALATACEVVRYTIYRWLDDDVPLSANGLQKLVEISNGKLTKKMLLPYLIVE